MTERGWYQSFRNPSKSLGFLTLRKTTSNKELYPKFSLNVRDFSLLENIPRESYVEVNFEPDSLGKPGELSLSSIKVLGSELDPNPTHRGKKNIEDESLKGYKKHFIAYNQSKVLNSIRAFLIEKGYLEVPFKKILNTGTEGGAEKFTLSGPGKKVLAQSPQLEKQIRVNYGLGKIYDIGKVFRAEKFKTTRHSEEFLSLDVEFLTDKLEEVYNLARDIIITSHKSVGKNLEESDFTVMNYEEAMRLLGTTQVELTRELQLRLMDLVSTPFLILTGYPESDRPFYTKDRKSFDILHKRLELVSGSLREEDIEKLNLKLTSRDLNPSEFQPYLQSFKHGAPQSGGFGLGLQRLMLIILDLSSIEELNVLV